MLIERTGLAQAVLASLLIAPILGCDAPPGRCNLVAPLCDVRTIAIEPAGAILTNVGQSTVLRVVARGSSGAEISAVNWGTITWVSSNEGVATVSGGGVVIAQGRGVAVISASSPQVLDSSRTASITVDPLAVATRLAIATQPGGGVLSGLLGPQPVVHLHTSSNELVAHTSVVTASLASGPGTLTGTTSVAAVAGVATFTNLSIAGTTGAHTIRFTAPGLTEVISAPFSVVAQPPAGVIHFSSDWRTATGYSSTAVRDGTKWPVMGGAWTGTGANLANGSVISASGLGFPAGMANVLRVTYQTSGSWGYVLARAQDNLWPVPQVGQTLFKRFYFRQMIRDAAGPQGQGSNHPFQGFDYDVTPICTFHWEFRWGSNTNGTFSFSVTYPQNSPFDWGLSLQKFRTYLMEIAYTKTATDRYRVRTRIDGVDRTADFRGWLNEPLSIAGPLIISDHCLRTLFVGNNDPFGWAAGLDATQDFALYGGVAFAVRADSNAWIGPYVP